MQSDRLILPLFKTLLSKSILVQFSYQQRKDKLIGMNSELQKNLKNKKLGDISMLSIKSRGWFTDLTRFKVWMNFPGD